MPPSKKQPEPIKVRIGSIDYTVESIGRQDFESEYVYGQVYFRDAVISIADDLSPPIWASTLLHEIFHCLFREWVGNSVWLIEDNKDTEEELVDRLSLGLCQVIRDNPALMDTITTMLDG